MTHTHLINMLDCNRVGAFRVRKGRTTRADDTVTKETDTVQSSLYLSPAMQMRRGGHNRPAMNTQTAALEQALASRLMTRRPADREILLPLPSGFRQRTDNEQLPVPVEGKKNAGLRLASNVEWNQFQKKNRKIWVLRTRLFEEFYFRYYLSHGCFYHDFVYWGESRRLSFRPRSAKISTILTFYDRLGIRECVWCRKQPAMFCLGDTLFSVLYWHAEVRCDDIKRVTI